MPSTHATEKVTIRQAQPEDAAVCGQICYDAFHTISQSHGFPCDLPEADYAKALLTRMFSHPGFYCLVAESEDRVVGSNCLDERSTIAGVGPITIDPQVQNSGIGRGLMESALARARERGAAGVRLVQAAFHNRSLSLYTSLGFDVREPLSCVQGRTIQRGVAGCDVRPAETSDLDDCNALSLRVHGFERGGDLAQAIQFGTALVVERGGQITGYMSSPAFFGHATAETNVDLQALIASAEGFGGPGLLIPSRNHALLRWCLANGLRVVQPMTLMTMGLYNDPAGAWIPSILF